MLDLALTRKNYKLGLKITIKTIVSIVLIALAIGLPQIVHLTVGSKGGMIWLPMYLPVLLAGCVLGVWWGLGVGIASPILSFLLTSINNNPMPALNRLPFMIVELAVFAVISGLFSKKINKNKWMAFPAIILAQLAGRVTFILMALIFQNVSGLSVEVVISQIRTGVSGLILQAVALPFIVIGLSIFLNKEKKND